MFDIPIFINTVLSTIAEQKRLLPSLVYTQSSTHVHASLTKKNSFSLAFAEKSSGKMKKNIGEVKEI